MGNVSIVIVSHSEKLGAGLVDLLRQLSQGSVHIVNAAGTESGLGTDATRVLTAIQECPAPADVLLFFDLGSALLSCDMALELLSEEDRQRVRIADAPLVEGAIAATVEACLNSPIDAVMGRAMEARTISKVPE